eukprot:243250-Pyramimonas_sp.AAC.1
MSTIDLAVEIRTPMRTMQKIPWRIRAQYLRILTEILVAVDMSYTINNSDGPSPTTTWTLFTLLPRPALATPRKPGRRSWGARATTTHCMV